MLEKMHSLNKESCHIYAGFRYGIKHSNHWVKILSPGTHFLIMWRHSQKDCLIEAFPYSRYNIVVFLSVKRSLPSIFCMDGHCVVVRFLLLLVSMPKYDRMGHDTEIIRDLPQSILCSCCLEHRIWTPRTKARLTHNPETLPAAYLFYIVIFLKFVALAL
jgi:hypothetical protein